MELGEYFAVSGAIAFGVALGGALIPLFKFVLEKAVSHFLDQRMEDYRYSIRVREQAAKVAEYLAIASRLGSQDASERYIRANQLSWELALYLPAGTYRHIRDAVARPNDERNLLTALVEVRGYLLRDGSGDLTAEDIAFHAPHAGLERQGPEISSS